MSLTDLPKCTLPDRPFELTLNDCLACSGCITLHEKKISLSELQQHPLNLILSIYVLTDLLQEFDPTEELISFKTDLIAHLKSIFKLNQIITTENTANFNLLTKEINKTIPLIITECPGTVTYIEKRRPEFLPHLSKTLTTQQIGAHLLTQKNHKILSVMQCTDKSLEKDVKIDFSLTGKDLYEILKETGFRKEFFNSSKELKESKMNDLSNDPLNDPSQIINNLIYKQSIIPTLINHLPYTQSTNKQSTVHSQSSTTKHNKTRPLK